MLPSAFPVALAAGAPLRGSGYAGKSASVLSAPGPLPEALLAPGAAARRAALRHDRPAARGAPDRAPLHRPRRRAGGAQVPVRRGRPLRRGRPVRPGAAGGDRLPGPGHRLEGHEPTQSRPDTARPAARHGLPQRPDSRGPAGADRRRYRTADQLLLPVLHPARGGDSASGRADRRHLAGRLAVRAVRGRVSPASSCYLG